jgi:hypothetical protein
MKSKCKGTTLFFYIAILASLIVSIATAVLPSLPASPVGYDVYGDGILLNVTTSDTLGFRHEHWTLYFTPTVGNLTSISTVIFFDGTNGTLGFIAAQDSTVQLSSDDPSIRLYLNGLDLISMAPLLSFTAGAEYVLQWSWQYAGVLPPSTAPTAILNILWQYLLNYDLVGFIFACYTSTIGQTFFVILAMLFTAPLYIRTKNLTVLGILWLLIGGIFIVAMPIVSPMAVLLTVLGLAAVLYKLFQHPT